MTNKIICLAIFIIALTFAVFAQKQSEKWLFIGKSNPQTSLFVNIANVKQDGETVQFIGKVEQLTQFTANCKTYEVSATQNGKQTATVKAEPNTFIRKAIDEVCGVEQ